jgi:hypothetical protein
LATQMVMAATIGTALSLITRPEQYPDSAVAGRMRDAVLDAVLTDAALTNVVVSNGSSVASTASTLSAQLILDHAPGLTKRESALLEEWLHRLADMDLARGVQPRAR